MATLNPYLNFEGNCEEAMNFYKGIFGGELVVQKVGDTPMAGKTPAGDTKVMHAALTAGSIGSIFASDMMDPGKANPGNMVILCVNTDSDEQAKDFYAKLLEGGSVGHPLEVQFWGDLFGDMTDKYGVKWMFNSAKKKA